MTITETLREKIGAPSIPDESVDQTAAILTRKILKYPCTDDEIGDTGDDVVSNIFKSVPKLNDLSVQDQKIVYDIVVRNLKKDEKNKIDNDHHKLLEEVEKITEKKRQKLLEEVKRIMTEKIDKRYSHEKIMALFLDTIKGKRPQSGKALFKGLMSKPRASLVSDSARMSQTSRASQRSRKSQTARKSSSRRSQSSSRRSQSSSRRSQTRHSRTSIPSNHASKPTHSQKTATTATDSILGGEATPYTLPTNTRPSQAGRHSLTANAAKRVSKSKRPSSSKIEIQKRATAGTEDEETEEEATSHDGGTRALHDEETHKAQGGQRKSESMKGKPKDDKDDEDVEDDEDDEDDEDEDEDGEEDEE